MSVVSPVRFLYCKEGVWGFLPDSLFAIQVFPFGIPSPIAGRGCTVRMNNHSD